MNWKSLIEDLLKSGMIQIEIAEAVGCRQGYISDILTGRRGRSVSWDIGNRLIALHDRRVKEAV